MQDKQPNLKKLSQAAKFNAMAKELGADDEEKSFDAKLKTLAQSQAKPAKGK